MGLTDTLSDWSNHRQLAKDLAANCRRPNRVPNIHPSDAICAKFNRFFTFWEEAYGRLSVEASQDQERIGATNPFAERS